MAIDNKVRKLIKELVEPTIRRAMEDREQLAKVNRESELQRRKIDEFEFSFHKIYKKLAIIDDVNKRQTDLEAAQRTVETKTTQQTQTLKTDMEALSADIQHKSETIKTFEKQIDHMNSQVRAFNEALMQFRSTVQTDLESNQNKTLEMVEEVKTALDALGETVNSHESQHARVNVLLGDSSAEVAAHGKLISAMRSKIEKLEIERATVSSLGDLKKELEKVHLKSLADKESLEKRLKVNKEALAAQGPIPVQLLMTEWLHGVLDQKLLKRLTDLEIMKYNSWLDLETLSYSIKPLVEAALQNSLMVQEQIQNLEKARPKSHSRDQFDDTSNSGVSHGSALAKGKLKSKKHNPDSEGSFKQGSDESGDLVHELSRGRSPVQPASRGSFSKPTVPQKSTESDRSFSPEATRSDHRTREELNPTPQFNRLEQMERTPTKAAEDLEVGKSVRIEPTERRVSIKPQPPVAEDSPNSSFHRRAKNQEDSASQVSRGEEVKGDEGKKPFTPASSIRSKSKHSEAQKPVEDGHLGVTAKSSVYSAQAQEFIAYYTDDSNESADQMNPAVEELRTQLDELAQKVNTELAVLRDELSEKFGDFQKEVRQSADACNSLAKQVISECGALNNQRKRDKTDIAAELTEVQEAMKSIKAEFTSTGSSIERLAQLYTHLVECCRISIALSAQDEEDRQSIALMGYKENRPQSRPGSALKPPVVSLDKQCLSCTGQSNIVVSAFKLACLAYAPTPISYRKSVYHRRELIDIEGKLLESAWDEASTSEPWISIKLKDTFEGVPIPRSVRTSQPTLQKASVNSWAPGPLPYPDSIISEEPRDEDSPEPKRALTAVGDRLPLLPKPSTSVSSRRK